MAHDTIEPTTAGDRIGNDLLVGAKAIADELGIARRQTFYLLETGRIPAFKLGRTWVARRSSIAAHLRRLEAEAQGGGHG